VAVGDRGTILTSLEGVNWVLRDSGSVATLRAVVFHGAIIVGGDAGTVLRSHGSYETISFPFAAPTSFDIRGLASVGSALVAVGNYSTAGRLHVSTDGQTWPGPSTEFARPLNAIAYGSGSFVAVGDGGLIIQSEIVPSVPPQLSFTRTSSSVILSWNGDYQLVTATNPLGRSISVPGVSSPLTNTVTDPQRYFQLRLPVP
jgi:hypothetical protein